MVVPSWQQLPGQHAAIQQPLLSDAGDWGRPLLVDSSSLLQDHRAPVFPLDVASADVYDPSNLVDSGAAAAWSSSKRSVAKAPSSTTSHHQHALAAAAAAAAAAAQQHHQHQTNHHLTVPRHHDTKKDNTQLSPVKKRVKEGTPPSGSFNFDLLFLLNKYSISKIAILPLIITDSLNCYITNSRRRHSPNHTSTALGAIASNSSHNSSAGIGINNTNNTLQWQHHSHHIQTTHHGQIQSHHNLVHQQSNNLPVSAHSTVPTMASAIVANTGVVQHSSKLHMNGNSRQQTITIRDTPSPAVSVITISDSEDEAPTKW